MNVKKIVLGAAAFAIAAAFTATAVYAVNTNNSNSGNTENSQSTTSIAESAKEDPVIIVTTNVEPAGAGTTDNSDELFETFKDEYGKSQEFYKEQRAKKLSAYESFGVTYDEATNGMTYDGKPVRYFEDEEENGITIYVFKQTSEDMIYLSTVRNENGDITEIKTISKDEINKSVDLDKITGEIHLGDFDFCGDDFLGDCDFFGDDFWDSFNFFGDDSSDDYDFFIGDGSFDFNDVLQSNINDFTDYESLGFSYDKDKDILTYKGEKVANFLDVSDIGKMRVYNNFEIADGLAITIVNNNNGTQCVIKGDCDEDFSDYGKITGMVVRDTEIGSVKLTEDIFTEYAPFGVTADFNNQTLSFNGEKIGAIVDKNGLIISSGDNNESLINVKVIRDEKGAITGIEKQKRFNCFYFGGCNEGYASFCTDCDSVFNSINFD